MRATTVFRNILQFPSTTVWAVDFGPHGLVAQVAPTTKIPRCSGCGCRCPHRYDARVRSWRHLDACGMPVEVRYVLRRVKCPRCGVVVEMVPWAESASGFTRDFEEHTAYLAQGTDRTTVASTMRIAWHTVGAIIHRVMGRRRDPKLLDGLVHIGIDELSYLRHHKYVTTVVDHERQRVVWASTGKSAATLDKFFDELGPERTAKIQSATMDMSGAFTKGVTMRAPGALIIYDKFHVLRLAQDAVDQVRRSEVRRLEDAGDRKTLKKVRWPLLKNEWNLTRVEKERLASLQRTNRKLYRAYLLKSALADTLAGCQIHVARTKLLEWISWASRSRLAPFKRVAATIKKHFAGVLAIVDTGFNNGRVEGLNGKIRVLTRRAYGFHSAPALISLIFLCCSGIDLHPIFKTPIHFH